VFELEERLWTFLKGLLIGGEEPIVDGGGLPGLPNLKMSELAASAIVGVDNFRATSLTEEL
jgi:hypothetical protein